MNRIFLALILCLSFLLNANAQTENKTIPSVDKSPLDESFYPANYPLLRIQGKSTESLRAKVIYSRPQKNDRVIFGGLLEYGKIWRLGANEATEVEFFSPVVINRVKVKKGRYTLYAIPEDSTKWTFILNKETDTWGAYAYDKTKDIVRTTVAIETVADSVEYFSMYFEKAAKGFLLTAVWDKSKAALPITY